MEMDMDVAWCLTCSKRTGDCRHPYCSDACRLQDANANSTPSAINNLTVALPPAFITTPAEATRSVSPVRPKHTATRPPVTPLLVFPPPASVIVASSSTPAKLLPRDRRAFSFPATNGPVPVFAPAKRQVRQMSQTVMPPFVRKPNGIAQGTVQIPPTSVEGGLKPGKVKANKSTGGQNTPFEPDSVFCSTSESSDNEDVRQSSLSRKKDLPQRPQGHQKSESLTVLPPETRFSTMKSHLSSSRPSYFSRRASQSPVAAMMASSGSSRSREDIISWARSIKLREVPPSHDESEAVENNEEDDDEDEDRGRGRSRTRKDVLDRPNTVNQDVLDEERAGTTPKGLSGALAGLNIGGFGGSIVKALTGMPMPPNVNAPMSISKVAVTTSTMGDDTMPLHYGGATPTLSTISFSEMDPSVVTDNQVEHIEVMDDQSTTASSFARKSSNGMVRVQKTSTPRVQQPTPLPIRPIAAGANALWSISTYLRSFTPFPVPGTKIISHQHQVASPIPPMKAILPDVHASPLEPAAPLIASRAPTPKEQVEIVRSLPMDILVSPEGQMQIRREPLIRSISRRRAVVTPEIEELDARQLQPRRDGWEGMEGDADISESEDEDFRSRRRGDRSDEERGRGRGRGLERRSSTLDRAGGRRESASRDRDREGERGRGRTVRV